jgi:hypothetical protein
MSTAATAVAVAWAVVAVGALALGLSGVTARLIQAAVFVRSPDPLAAQRAGGRLRSGVVGGGLVAGALLVAVLLPAGVSWREMVAIPLAAGVVGAASYWQARRLASVPPADEETSTWGRRVRRLFRIATEPSTASEMHGSAMATYVRHGHDAVSALGQWIAVSALALTIPTGRAAIVAAVWLGICWQRRARLLRAGALA